MSVLLSDRKCLFLHIPRTGGWWVRWALDELEIENGAWILANQKEITRSHALLPHYFFRHDALKIRSAFAFVRHPIAYYESVWMYFWKAGEKGRSNMMRRFTWHPHELQVELWCPNFSEWVRRLLDTRPGWYSQMIDLYVGPQGGEYCTFVGRTENLPEHLFFILKEMKYKLDDSKLGLLKNSEKKNISGDRDQQGIKEQLNWDRHLDLEVLDSEFSMVSRFYNGNESLVRMF